MERFVKRIVLALVLISCRCLRPQFPPRARKLHEDAFVFDAHVHAIDRQFYHGGDIGQRVTDGQFDLPRAKEGGVDAMFFSIFVTEDYYPQRLETKQTLRLDGPRAHAARTEPGQDRAGEELPRTSSGSTSPARSRRFSISKAGSTSMATSAVLRDLVPPGLTLGAAFRAQLGQQFRRLLLLPAEISRPERSRPRGCSRDESARDGDQCVARVG